MYGLILSNPASSRMELYLAHCSVSEWAVAGMRIP